MTELLARLLGRLPIGWLQLTHNRTRLAAALAGVAFANILVFTQLGFLGALVESIALPYRAMNADLIISGSDANTLTDGNPLPRQRMYQALMSPGVAEITPLYYGKIDWKQPDGTVRQLDVFGIDPAATAFRNDSINAARDQLQIADNAILDRRTRNVPSDVFKAIEAGAPHVFEANNTRLTVIDTFELGGSFTADGYLIVSDQTFLRLFRSRVAGAPTHMFVKLKPGTDVRSAVIELASLLPASDTQVRTVADAVARDQSFQTTQRPVGIVFGFGVGIGILVGIIIVYQVLSTDVADHLREYATLKAIGYRQRFFLGIVFEEALILALLGFIPGVLISMGIYALVGQATGLPMAMTAGRPPLVLVGTIAMCVVSGALATRRLARADPAELF